MRHDGAIVNNTSTAVTESELLWLFTLLFDIFDIFDIFFITLRTFLGEWLQQVWLQKHCS